MLPGDSSMRQLSSPRKEECVAANIASNLAIVVLLRIELLPSTRRENVLIPLVPATIDDLGKGRIITSALEPSDIDGHLSLRPTGV
jgi:hypothetical protein